MTNSFQSNKINKTFISLDGIGQSPEKSQTLSLAVTSLRIHVFFYQKLKSVAGRQFLKFSGHFATKNFLHLS